MALAIKSVNMKVEQKKAKIFNTKLHHAPKKKYGFGVKRDITNEIKLINALVVFCSVDKLSV